MLGLNKISDTNTKYWSIQGVSNTKMHLETDIAYQFILLKKNWLEETKFESNPRFIYSNKYYLQIIAKGLEIAPLLIEDLILNKNDWFFALKEIMNIDPVKPEHYGNYNAMINDWKEWIDRNN